MTSLIPRKSYTEDELLKYYPPGLELQQVQILLRHGERTPVSPRFQSAGLQPFWAECKAVRNMRDAILVDAENGAGKVFTTLEWKRRLETFGEGDSPVVAKGVGGKLDDICDMGKFHSSISQNTDATVPQLIYLSSLRLQNPTSGCQ